MGIFAQKLPCRANRIDLQLEGALPVFKIRSSFSGFEENSRDSHLSNTVRLDWIPQRFLVGKRRDS